MFPAEFCFLRKSSESDADLSAIVLRALRRRRVGNMTPGCASSPEPSKGGRCREGARSETPRPVRPQWADTQAQTLAGRPQPPSGEVRGDAANIGVINMETTDTRKVPVLGRDGRPLVPCHPARARELMRTRRARPHRVRGVFCIQTMDRGREDSKANPVALKIDPGSRMSGMAVTREEPDGATTRGLSNAFLVQHPCFTI